MPELPWIDIEPGQFLLRKRDEPMNLALGFHDEDFAVEEPLVLGGVLEAQERLGQACGFELVQPRRIMDDAQSFPVGRRVGMSMRDATSVLPRD